MANIIDVIGKYFRPYKRIFLILFLLVLFILIGVYCYNYFYIPKKQNAIFSDVANANTAKKPMEIYFFYATWCPHCKSAFPEWKKFEEEYDGKDVGLYKIKCIKIDCTNDQANENESGMKASKITQLINDFKVDSYPTIKMMKDNTNIDFDAKVSKYNLEQFVHSVTSS
jgi:hypothetical protein